MAAAVDLPAELASLAAVLDAAIARLKAEARPAPSLLEDLAAALVKTHAVLGTVEADAASGGAEDRLAVLRQAIGVRERLLVVARLGAGSAWYASLAREFEGLNGARKGATYGRTGTAAVPPAGSSIERRA